ncbi:MAG: hypothetical protein Q9168_007949, partial [Polycauliona sp. 1 TL-2023]
HRTAHPGPSEVKILAYTWIRNTPAPYINNSLTAIPTQSRPLIYPVATMGVLVPPGHKRKREAVDDQPRLHENAKVWDDEIVVGGNMSSAPVALGEWMFLEQ